jgi:hypothetical protein
MHVNDCKANFFFCFHQKYEKKNLNPFSELTIPRLEFESGLLQPQCKVPTTRRSGLFGDF